MIPEAAVEAAIKAFSPVSGGFSNVIWDNMTAALEAATPAVEAAVLATAIGYAEDQAMAGAFFPEWQRCADMLREMCTRRGIQIDG